MDVDAGGVTGRRLWIPLLDGTERTGVMELEVGDHPDCVPAAIVAPLERLAHVAAAMVITKGASSGALGGSHIGGEPPSVVFDHTAGRVGLIGRWRSRLLAR